MPSNGEDVKEFWDNVWDHVNEPILEGFDVPDEIPMDMMAEIIKMAICSKKGDIEGVKQIIDRGSKIWVDGRFLYLVLQLSGLTRSKILTDLRKIASEIDIVVPHETKTLPKREKLWIPALTVIAERFGIVIEPLEVVTPDVISALNRATWPGYIRQEKAKRGGHACEQRLAMAFRATGIPFVPEEKVSNPLCGDIQIFGESFDVIVPSESSPAVCFKSTVHTAAIGQYGESKDSLEIITAVQKFQEKFPNNRPLIMALVDGVGYSSNPSGLKDILKNADEFCQFATLWKAVVVVSSQIRDEGLRIHLSEDDFERYDEFLSRYGYDESKRLHAIPEKPIKIGRALFERFKPGPLGEPKKDRVQLIFQ
ncbi:MAG: hypothetical protein SA339_07140 [Methanomassiliicoccus sp.]|nr:hypothetical protein [Methanomassiliicoccus sp.]